MESVTIAILKIAFGFGIILAVHELGHAIAAMLCGIKVQRFSIGIGPGLKIRNVPKLNELVITPFVIGAYVMLDENDLARKSFWKRNFVYVAGMLSNVIVAILILIAYGVAVSKAIGVSFYIWLAGWPLTISMLTSGAVAPSEAVSGPIGIGQMMAGSQFPYFITLALLNLAVAMFNLLPLPPFDGGHMMTSVLEKIMSKERLKKTVFVLQMVGLAFIGFLLVFGTIGDLSKIFKPPSR
ncbi:MAG: hypothetical protein A2214_00430 [Candidatus Harrisonbacteria bacterium RIFOXYA1_FULL_48_8]|uniref:Peptidase M50 domain-containing protein n=2 Tax=Candidatus Harrisoniibacteriota TaxID=1817905 RepID=A0A1G1ZWC9_9BACT|nr:MAG: hypothetical protein A3E64_02610 [Candidatus Harrisonbacteria bacterium RIFCSPHIGHO2_12_FULL_48_16]OGY68456.1 MAG: hypothetical protein A2214_00430 [Candidatus Harrisonbacteria bacterium RIFOXYA1_FULL_48_8]